MCRYLNMYVASYNVNFVLQDKITTIPFFTLFSPTFHITQQRLYACGVQKMIYMCFFNKNELSPTSQPSLISSFATSIVLIWRESES